jgi:hypothetical protein
MCQSWAKKSKFIPLSLRLSGIIVFPPRVARSKFFFYKTLIQYLSIITKEIVQNSKSEPKPCVNKYRSIHSIQCVTEGEVIGYVYLTRFRTYKIAYPLHTKPRKVEGLRHLPPSPFNGQF